MAAVLKKQVEGASTNLRPLPMEATLFVCSLEVFSADSVDSKPHRFFFRHLSGNLGHPGGWTEPGHQADLDHLVGRHYFRIRFSRKDLVCDVPFWSSHHLD